MLWIRFLSAVLPQSLALGEFSAAGCAGITAGAVRVRGAGSVAAFAIGSHLPRRVPGQVQSSFCSRRGSAQAEQEQPDAGLPGQGLTADGRKCFEREGAGGVGDR